MKYKSTKTYGHDLGLSACFRQWRADSHCNKLHGYALSFHFEFGAEELDERGWVVDFGALKELKQFLQETFDHVTCVAGDDPQLEHFVAMNDLGIMNIKMFPDGVGCERFARHAYWAAAGVISRLGLGDRVKVLSCECAEHGANSAIFQP